MSTLFLNPNLTPEQAMDLYERKAMGMARVAENCFDGIKPTLAEWAAQDAEWDAKFPAKTKAEQSIREMQRKIRDMEHENFMIGLGMQCLIMGLF